MIDPWKRSQKRCYKHRCSMYMVVAVVFIIILNMVLIQVYYLAFDTDPHGNYRIASTLLIRNGYSESDWEHRLLKYNEKLSLLHNIYHTPNPKDNTQIPNVRKRKQISTFFDFCHQFYSWYKNKNHFFIQMPKDYSMSTMYNIANTFENYEKIYDMSQVNEIKQQKGKFKALSIKNKNVDGDVWIINRYGYICSKTFEIIGKNEQEIIHGLKYGNAKLDTNLSVITNPSFISDINGSNISSNSFVINVCLPKLFFKYQSMMKIFETFDNFIGNKTALDMYKINIDNVERTGFYSKTYFLNTKENNFNNGKIIKRLTNIALNEWNQDLNGGLGSGSSSIRWILSSLTKEKLNDKSENYRVFDNTTELIDYINIEEKEKDLKILSQPIMIQQLIDKPWLTKGKHLCKIDIFVLITSIDPLQAWINPMIPVIRCSKSIFRVKKLNINSRWQDSNGYVMIDFDKYQSMIDNNWKLMLNDIDYDNKYIYNNCSTSYDLYNYIGCNMFDCGEIRLINRRYEKLNRNIEKTVRFGLSGLHYGIVKNNHVGKTLRQLQDDESERMLDKSKQNIYLFDICFQLVVDYQLNVYIVNVKMQCQKYLKKQNNVNVDLRMDLNFHSLKIASQQLFDQYSSQSGKSSQQCENHGSWVRIF